MDPSGFLVPATAEAHISHADNHPSPTLVPNHNHPPYAEMIAAAISALKEKNGSSRQAIAKYIEGAYKDQLPPTHSTLLTHHLKRLKTNGHLLMFKHSYMLPRSDSSPPPPHPPPVPASTAETSRKRGRPPKPKTVDFPLTDPILVATTLVDAAALPPTYTSTATAAATIPPPPPPTETVTTRRKSGRPRKTKLVSGVMGPEKIKRRPGRPAKIQSMPVMIPYLSDDAPPRPRGRPKRDGSSRANAPRRARVQPPPMNATAASNGGGMVSARRRGRPPSVGGRKKPVKGVGKPAGRPRKNNVLARVQSAGSPLWMVDYGHVKSKVDNVQSRIKQVVSLLKPHFINENAVTVAAALQELEEISTMDVIGAPSHVAQVKEPVSQPLNVEGQEPVLQNEEPHLEHARV